MAPQHDQPPAGNLFASRLRQALEQRRLSLARVRAHLAAAGLSVSVATLSYWSTGRSLPTRGNSRAVIEELERVLQVERGWFLDALGERTLTGFGELIGQSEAYDRAIEENGLRVDRGWQELSLHHTLWVGPDRAQKQAETRRLARATRDGQQYWVFCVALHGGAAICEVTSACRMTRSVRFAADGTLFEFALDRPLASGERVLSSHLIEYPMNGDATSVCGYGLSRGGVELVLEVHFEGEMPHGFRRTFTPPGAAEAVTVPTQVFAGRGIAQAVVDSAQPGIHRLEWDW